MSDFTCDIDGMDDLVKDLADATKQLNRDLSEAALDAAAGAMRAFQGSHPYQDRTYGLTGDSHVEQDSASGRDASGRFTGVRGAALVWPAPYASFVDEGTSRSKAYPFRERTEKNAEQRFADLSLKAVDKFVKKVGG